jgi:hypothetical protein
MSDIHCQVIQVYILDSVLVKFHQSVEWVEYWIPACGEIVVSKGGLSDAVTAARGREGGC